jgi:multiple sugar transport system substrate-binding protein
MKRNVWIYAAIIVCLALLAGCGSDSAGNSAETQNTPQNSSQNPSQSQSPSPSTPVTLKVHPYKSNITQDDFQLMLVNPVKSKHPHLTLEMVGSGKNINELLASGETPDLLLTWQGTLSSLKLVDLQYDLTSQVKEANVDLGRFNPVSLNAVRVMSDKNELLALPYEMNFGALYYNKDMFDKFGVAYPRDGMTWEDTIELGRKVTREEGGVAYRGLDYDTLQILSLPLGITFLDAKTDKANVNSEPWKRVLVLAKQIYDIPGNMPAKLDTAKNDFMRERTLAMLPTVNLFYRLNEPTVSDNLKWDIAQYPSYKDRPNTYGMVDLRVIAITPTSKHKAEAMQVVQTLISDEVQLNNAKKTGRATPLKNGEINKAIGADMPFMKGIHTQSVFKSHPAAAPSVSMFESQGKKMVNDAYKEYLAGEDLNTVLRKAEELTNKQLEAESGKGAQ